MLVHELVSRTLAELGVGHAFGVVGSGNFDVTRGLIAAGVPFLAARHEGGAATMADAFARTSGDVGILTVHQGCGLTNAMTGIAEAAKSRTPLLVLAADSAASAVRSNFRIDQDALVRSVGAVSERVHSPASALADTVRAWRTARNGRRTVVLNLPLDVQAMTVPDAALSNAAVVQIPAPVRPGAAAVEQLAAVLATAERPVFVAGRGARGHREVLTQLGDRVGAVLATSAVAKGLFEGDPYDVGISGGFSSPLAADLIRGADVLVAWGCSLTMWTIRHGSLIAPGTRVIQVDLDEDTLGANRPIDLGVVGDVGETAAAVLAQVAAASGYRTAELAEQIAAEARWSDVAIDDDTSTDTTIDPRLLSAELDRRLPPNRVLSVDSGNFMGYPSAYLRVPDEAGFCFTQAFQSIGLGLSTAIGAALALPDRLPILGTGDGGLLMVAAELETLSRSGIGMLVVVYDDAAYGAEVHHFGPMGLDLDSVVFPDRDIAAIARGYGLDAAIVRSVADLGVLDDWLAGPRTTSLLLDAKISDDGGSWWLAEAFRGH